MPEPIDGEVQNIGNRTPEDSAVFVNAGITDGFINVIANGERGNNNLDDWFNKARTDKFQHYSCLDFCGGAVVKSIEDTRQGEALPAKFYERDKVRAYQDPITVYVKPGAGVAVTVIGNDPKNPCYIDSTQELPDHCKSVGWGSRTKYKYLVQKNCNHVKYRWDTDCSTGTPNMVYPPTSGVGEKYAASDMRKNQLADCNVSSGNVNFDEPIGPTGKNCKAMCMRTENASECATAVETYCRAKLIQGEDIRNTDRYEICKKMAPNIIKTVCTGANLDSNRVCKSICTDLTNNSEACIGKIKDFCQGPNIQTSFCRTVLADTEMFGKHNAVMDNYCTTDPTGMNSTICKCINITQFHKDVDTYVNRTAEEKNAVKTRPDCFFDGCAGAGVYKRAYNEQCPPLCINNIGTLMNKGNVTMNNKCNSTTNGTSGTTNNTNTNQSQSTPASSSSKKGILLLLGGGGISTFMICICCICICCFLVMMNKRR